MTTVVTDYQPEGFALDIFRKRYALHDKETWNEACERVATHIASAERPERLVETEQQFNDILLKNLFMPGGRIWYGSGRPKGQLLNCFVVPTEDSREGWGKTASDMIVISGTGGGLGVNFSPIRPRDSQINGSGGKATGATSLMEIINSAGDVIKAGGGRRVALMFALSLNHGDIEEFLDKKLDMKKLNNANVSVVFDDDPEIFFDLVRRDALLELKFRGKVVAQVPARRVFDKIIQNALKAGEPGVLNGYLANKMNNIWYDRPLVCTNPCVTGDTLIAVADGRNAVSIEQLALEGVDVPVYSTDIETGQVQIKIGRNPRKTGTKSEIWKLTLDDGTVLRATPNHRILMKDLSYVELKDLKSGDSISPFNTFDSNGYRQVCNTGKKMSGGRFRNRRQYRLISEITNGPVDAKLFAIHHRDFNSKNDRLNNLQVMLREEHTKLHAEKMMGDKNPYHRMTDEWKQSFASHPAEKNPRWIDVSNEDLIEHGRKVLSENGKLNSSIWAVYAKENGLPQSLANQARFGTFKNFESLVIGNHKVLSVEFCGYEDVYNITVDDNHNYHVITSGDETFTKSSGICVKNCGEIWLAAYDCCCLGALVLPRFVASTGAGPQIDWKLLADTIKTSVRFLDDVLSVNNYPLAEIRQTCSDIRRIGLGIMGLHDMLLMLGLRYADPESLELIDKVMGFIKDKAFEASTELAAEKGAFPKFDPEKFLKGGFAKTLRPKLRALIKERGIRNCALLTIAPTGTTAIVCGCTSGIENCFGSGWLRRYWDGDVLKEEVVINPLFKRMVESGQDVSHFQSVYDLDLRDHFEVQRACQRHLDNACSKTINIPQGISAEKLGDLYMEYFPELKGVTIYPEGSRENQPIVPLPMADVLQRMGQLPAAVGAISSDNCRSGICEI